MYNSQKCYYLVFLCNLLQKIEKQKNKSFINKKKRNLFCFTNEHSFKILMSSISALFSVISTVPTT